MHPDGCYAAVVNEGKQQTCYGHGHRQSWYTQPEPFCSFPPACIQRKVSDLPKEPPGQEASSTSSNTMPIQLAFLHLLDPSLQPAITSIYLLFIYLIYYQTGGTL
jgi:hypothetical protein